MDTKHLPATWKKRMKAIRLSARRVADHLKEPRGTIVRNIGQAHMGELQRIPRILQIESAICYFERHGVWKR